jgi:hypothetical protein
MLKFKFVVVVSAAPKFPLYKIMKSLRSSAPFMGCGLSSIAVALIALGCLSPAAFSQTAETLDFSIRAFDAFLTNVPPAQEIRQCQSGRADGGQPPSRRSGALARREDGRTARPTLKIKINP